MSTNIANQGTDSNVDTPAVFLRGGGEMGRRMRQTDWAGTPLGPAEQWPQSLKTAVRITLTCRQPMFVWWGEEFYNLYNDAYIPILGAKHPHSFARPASEVWSEIWHEIGPRAESALLGDEGTFDEDLLLVMDRHGYPEETYFSFSYSPVPNDDGGTGGMICACTEETRRVIGERRLTLLRELALQTENAKSRDEVWSGSARALLSDPHDFPFAAFYSFAPDDNTLTLKSNVRLAGNGSPLPQVVDVAAADPDWSLASVLESNEPVRIIDLSQRCADLPGGAWEISPDRAAIVAITSPGTGRPAGVLVAGLNPYRPFNDDDAGFVQLMTDQIAAVIARVEAFETERERAESLAELDQAKTAFFSNVSHEFRTPLTLILGPIEELIARAESVNLPDDALSLLDAAHRNGKRLLKLVNALLDFSRIEAGRTEANFEKVDLGTFTADLASSFESAMQRAGLEYCVRCQTDTDATWIDRDMWEKIVLNLISNAFKYTFEGRIEVSLDIDHDNDRAVLQVSDTGTGIAADQQTHLFDRFYRLEGARGRSREGSGIGLALVKELTHLHGGEISVTSQEGKGSCFSVALPLGRDHLPEDQVVVDEPPAPTASGDSAYVEEAIRWIPGATANDDSKTTSAPNHRVRKPNVHVEGLPRILLADDNADMLQYLQRLLSRSYNVLPVTNGMQALEVARAENPDLIISDIMMPELDGIGLLERLRDDPVTAQIPVFFLSARAGEGDRIAGIKAGADEYLAKPFSARELVARVDGALNLARVRKEARARERELEEETANVLQSMMEGYIAFDSEFTFRAVNDRAASILGMSRSQLIGQNQWELFPDLRGSIADKQYHKALNEKVPVYFDIYYEPWNRWFDVGAYPAKNGGLDVYFRDITKRAKAEAILDGQKRALERTMQMAPLSSVLDILVNIAESMTDTEVVSSILLLDEDGSRLRVGSAPGLPDEYNDAVDGLEIGPCAGSCGTAAFLAETVIVSDIENDPLWADYKHLALKFNLRSCWSTPILSTQGKVLGTFALYQRAVSDPSPTDMTMVELLANTASVVIERERERGERLKIAESLKTADRRKDEFLATLAHELRNPLAPIRTGLEVLKMQHDDAEVSAKVRDMMERQLKQLVRLVDDLLDVSRITRGKLQLRKQLVSPAEVLSNAIEASQPFLDEAKHRFSASLPPEDCVIEGDPERLAQIFSNLLNNAAKYTREGGTIELHSAIDPDNQLLRVSISDNGEGISADMQSHIFDMFTQVEPAQDRTSQGLGIGLTLVRSLLDMHGGEIAVESRGKGYGSTFHVTLPLPGSPEPSNTVVESPQKVEPNSPAATKPKVLIADDNRNAADVLALFFELEGYDVITASDGAAAVDKAATFDPDIVLLDIGMPMMDGNQAAREIRKLPRGGEKILIALTGWGRDEDRRKTSESGFQYHLVKPVEPNQLRELLAEITKPD